MPFTKWVDLLGAWKQLLPDKFQEFLDKYDGTLPEAVYDTYQKKHNKEMEVYPRQMLVIYTLIDSVIVLTLLRVLFFIDHTLFGEHDDRFYELIKHIDLAGLSNGALATILTIIIARIVESDHENKQEKLDANIRHIKETTVVINKTNKAIQETTKNLTEEVGKILSSYTALERKDSFEERLEAYKEVLEMAKKQPNNCLYFMSFSADFGCLRSQNLSVLMEEEANGNPPHQENLKKTFDSFDRTIDALSHDLKYLCADRPKSAFLAFLDVSDDNRPRLSQHQKYLQRVLGSDTAEVTPWQKPGESDDDMEIRLSEYVKKAKLEDVALYIDFENDEQGGTPNENLTKKLVKKNIEKIKELKRTKAQVTLLDRMAFQFVLTTPDSKGGVRNRTNQCCVITFSNVDAIGDNAGVYAFQSTDGGTIDNLKNMFDTYQKQQEKRNERSKKKLDEWRSFTELFGIQPERKGYNVLKFKNLKEEVSEMLNGVAMADIGAAFWIQDMFLKAEETIPEIKYPISVDGEGKVNDYTDGFFDKDGTYFAIGLFGENEAPGTLAEYVSRQYPDLCTFVRRGMAVAPLLSTDGSSELLHNVLVINGKEIVPTWEKGNKKDVALIAKLKLNVRGRNVTVFVLGGINHFGAEQIGRYLAENWQKIHSQVGNKPFFALYDVDLENEIPFRESHFYLPDLSYPGKWAARNAPVLLV